MHSKRNSNKPITTLVLHFYSISLVISFLLMFSLYYISLPLANFQPPLHSQISIHLILLNYVNSSKSIRLLRNTSYKACDIRQYRSSSHRRHIYQQEIDQLQS
ncbi:unnamed protein product [Schistosoma curassoni]|nr:unnamed protein product [Schistosoma curassoni]